MKVRILSLRGVFFEGPATALNVKTASGEVTILPHHRPIISLLTPGMLWYEVAGKRQEVPVSGGILEMNARNELTVLVG